MLATTALLCSAFVVPTPPMVTPSASAVVARGVAPRMLDMDTIGGVAIALAGVGGGIGLIAFTENAGKRNEEAANQQPCVVCEGKQVVECPVCKGEGRGQFAELVAGVQEFSGEQPTSVSTVTVDDWADGPKQVQMFEEILNRYPQKFTGKGMCINCDGRGVVVCDNCQGTGIQPRFLERYSPDDFMD